MSTNFVARIIGVSRVLKTYIDLNIYKNKKQKGKVTIKETTNEKMVINNNPCVIYKSFVC